METVEWIAAHWGPDVLSDSIDWDSGGRVHNWRRYVGERTRKVWTRLSYEVRLAIALDADDRAGMEDWD